MLNFARLFKFDALTLLLILYIILHSLLAILYFITAYRILVMGKKSKAKKGLEFITYRIIVSGISSLMGSAMLLLFTLAYTPLQYVLSWFFTWIFHNIASFLLIIIFSPHKEQPTIT